MDQTNDIAIPSSDAEKSTPTDRKPKGAFEARYLAFLDTVTDLRPKLHRYCARMTGSIFELVRARGNQAKISADCLSRLIKRVHGNAAPSQAVRRQALLYARGEEEFLFDLAIALL